MGSQMSSKTSQRGVSTPSNLPLDPPIITIIIYVTLNRFKSKFEKGTCDFQINKNWRTIAYKIFVACSAFLQFIQRLGQIVFHKVSFSNCLSQSWLS